MKNYFLLFILAFMIVCCEQAEIASPSSSLKEKELSTSPIIPNKSGSVASTCAVNEIFPHGNCDITFTSIDCMSVGCALRHLDDQLTISMLAIDWTPNDPANNAFEVWLTTDTGSPISLVDSGIIGDDIVFTLPQNGPHGFNHYFRVYILNENCSIRYLASGVVNPPPVCEDQHIECPTIAAITGIRYWADVTLVKQHATCQHLDTKSTVYMKMFENGEEKCIGQFDFQLGEMVKTATIQIPNNLDFWFSISSCPHENEVCSPLQDNIIVSIDTDVTMIVPETQPPTYPDCSEIWFYIDNVLQNQTANSISATGFVSFQEAWTAGCHSPDLGGLPIRQFKAGIFKVVCVNVNQN